jgi:DNA replication factor GINS
MNLDELRTVRRTERQKDTLQHLRDSFYRDVAEYIEDLKAQRKQAAAAADDPFGDPEVGRLSDEIETAEEVVESLYERRVGKVVKLATFAAADMSGDEGGLTHEERNLYDDLVDRIRQNRETVLETLSGGHAAGDDAGADEGDADEGAATADGPAAVEPDTPAPVADAGDDDVLAAAMGDDGPATKDGSAGTDDAAPAASDSPADAAGGDRREVPPDAPADAPVDGDTGAPADAGTGDAADAGAPDAAGSTSPEADRTTVRITRDVGEIFGVDQRSYDLEREDVVTLPADNAEPLLRKDAAERLD